MTADYRLIADRMIEKYGAKIALERVMRHAQQNPYSRMFLGHVAVSIAQAILREGKSI